MHIYWSSACVNVPSMDWFKVSVVWWAFCTNLLIAGPLKIMGIYFLQFQLHLDASANETSVIFALLYSIYFFSGKFPLFYLNLQVRFK